MYFPFLACFKLRPLKILLSFDFDFDFFQRKFVETFQISQIFQRLGSMIIPVKFAFFCEVWMMDTAPKAVKKKKSLVFK